MGTLDIGRLNGTYNISISGSANNASLLGSEPKEFYTNASNITSGTLNVSRLNGTYNISISGSAATAGTSISAAMTLSYSSVSSSYTVKFFRIGDFCYMALPESSVANSGVSTTTISYATVPVFYRPIESHYYNVWVKNGSSGDAPGKLIVQTSGQITIALSSGGNFAIQGNLGVYAQVIGWRLS